MGSCFSTKATVKKSRSAAFEADKLVMVPEKKGRAESGELGSVDERRRQSSDLSSLRKSYAGSKDEAFFDSLAWLESDSDDDYVSVRGDFTPHSGNTFQGSPVVAARPTLASIVSSMSDPKAITVVGLSDSNPQNSPIDNKKRLEDLFKETKDDGIAGDMIAAPLQSSATDLVNVNGEKVGVNEPNAALTLKVLMASTPTHAESDSSGNGETRKGMSSEARYRRECKGNQCCMPGLLRSFSFPDRKKLSLSSPIRAVEAAA